MNSIIKFGAAVALILGLAIPASALAYFPYTSFSGQNYFVGGGNFNVQQPNYYGSSNCNYAYGCGNIGYNAMTGQWYNYGQGGYGMGYGGYGMGYGNYGYGYGMGGGNAYSGIGSYNQNYNQYGASYGYGNNSGCNPYIPNNACGIIGQYTQYLPGSYGTYGGYGSNGYVY